MEFADENSILFCASCSEMAGVVKIFFTPVCASSKLPLMAQTVTFLPSWVFIWCFCMGLTPSTG